MARDRQAGRRVNLSSGGDVMGRPRNAEKFLKYWQKELNIGWGVGLLRDKTLFTKHGNLAKIDWITEREEAIITMATDRQIKSNDIDNAPEHAVESVILHELLHLRLHGYMSMDEFSELYPTDSDVNHVERAINNLTKCMIKLKYGGQNEN